jgi:DNA-binding MarR family transcriptional regulator
MSRPLDDADFQRLLEFRVELRRFLSWSEEKAKQFGLTPAQHQLLLAVRGYPAPQGAASQGPAIGDVARALLLRHHSAVELVDRAVTAGLVERAADASDRRRVRLRLTALGTAKLERLAAVHLEELSRLAPLLRALSGEPQALPHDAPPTIA